MSSLYSPLKVTVSGSYQKFPEEISDSLKHFQDLGAVILSPPCTEILGIKEGFATLRGDPINLHFLSDSLVYRGMRAIENHHLNAITNADLLWVVLPGGYCGQSTTFEIGWAIAHHIPVYTTIQDYVTAKEPIVKAYVNPVSSIESFLTTFDPIKNKKNDTPTSQHLLIDLTTKLLNLQKPNQELNATIAVGAIIVDNQSLDTLFVKTHKWGGHYSIVGGRINPREQLLEGINRHVQHQIGLSNNPLAQICTFDEFPDSGYHQTNTHRTFIDYVVKVHSRNVHLDNQAQEYIWLPPEIALRDLDFEPNAKETLTKYLTQFCQ